MDLKTIQNYIKKADPLEKHLQFAPQSVERVGNELVSEIRILSEYVDSLTDFPDELFIYPVPTVDVDGSFDSNQLSETPFNLERFVRGDRIDKAKTILVLNNIVALLYDLSKLKWVGLFKRFPAEGRLPSRLTKIAYKGCATPAEYPLSSECAHSSLISRSGLQEMVEIEADVSSPSNGRPLRTCDRSTGSAVALPIFAPDLSAFTGLLYAESEQPNDFDARKLGRLVACALHVSRRI